MRTISGILNRIVAIFDVLAYPYLEGPLNKL